MENFAKSPSTPEGTVIMNKIRRSMKTCLIVSLSAHFSIAAFCAIIVRKHTDSRIKGKTVLFVSLDPLPAVIPAGGRPRKIETVKSIGTESAVHGMRQPAETENPHAVHEDLKITAETIRQKLPTPQPAVGVVTTLPTADAGITPAAQSPAGAGNNAGPANNAVAGNTTGMTSVEDFTFGNGSGPAFLRRSLPMYPPLARRFGREGKVVLRLTIDESGTLSGIEVLEDPGYGFASAAVAAIKKSTFSPARRNGRPVMARAILPVRFKLRERN
jgi:TonB family protein